MVGVWILLYEVGFFVEDVVMVFFVGGFGVCFGLVLVVRIGFFFDLSLDWVVVLGNVVGSGVV